MALILADRVRDTTTTTGTGTVTLSGTAPTGYQNFSAVGNGNTTYYTINGGSQWEVGIGTYTAAGTTLSRDTVLASSTGSKLALAAGTKDVFVTYPAGKAVNYDASGNVLIGTTSSPTESRLYIDSTEARIQSRNSTSGANGYVGALSTNEWRGAWAITSTPVTFGTSNAERVLIDSAGNVGIGTSSPGQKLTVAGTVESTSGGFKFPDATTQTTAYIAQPTDFQEFTSSGTWTKPANATFVLVECWGAGGGGGSGAYGTSVVRGGGGGGSGGAFAFAVFKASDLADTVSVTVGSGGTGGAAKTALAAGNAGNAGGSTSFGTAVTSGGGLGGSGGGYSSTTSAAGGNPVAISSGGGGGGNGGNGGSAGMSASQAGAGGGGGGGSNGTTAYVAYAGGSNLGYSGGGGAAGGTSAAGGTPTTLGFGGGGGGSSAASSGGSGGTGATAGGGGGGGGTATSGTGAGGTGGNGICRIYSW